MQDHARLTAMEFGTTLRDVRAVPLVMASSSSSSKWRCGGRLETRAFVVDNGVLTRCGASPELPPFFIAGSGAMSPGCSSESTLTALSPSSPITGSAGLVQEMSPLPEAPYAAMQTHGFKFSHGASPMPVSKRLFPSSPQKRPHRLVPNSFRPSKRVRRAAPNGRSSIVQICDFVCVSEESKAGALSLFDACDKMGLIDAGLENMYAAASMFVSLSREMNFEGNSS